MVDCSFCDKEFDSKQELHVHWGEEHEEELNSHQKDKVKKARRKQDEEKERKKKERKKKAFYSLAAVLGLALTGLVLPQLLQANASAGSTDLNLEGQPMLGNPNASVTVVEFGDYRCPYCKRFEQATFPKLKNQYIDTGKIKFYFVNYAFLGPGSQKAAVAAECVYDQDKTQYWDFHQAIYENQGPESEKWVTTDLLMDLAREHTDGLDYEKLRQCIESQETRPEVLEDKNMGLNNGVDSTPTIFVNGRKVNGNSFNAVKSVIEQELP